MHFCVGSNVYQHDDLFGDFVILRMFYCFQHKNNVYQVFNFRKIKHLFMVSARFCEIYFTR